MVMLYNLKNIFVVPDLRKKALFTLWVLFVFRLGSYIPLPGIDTDKLANAVERATGGIAAFLNYLDLVAGGALKRFAIFALGISPYITASIMMQLLTVMIPTLEQLSKEGEYGRRVINQYTRYLTFVISIGQGFAMAKIIAANDFAINPTWGFYLTSIFILTVGSMFVMWMGEQITAHGIGNGSSMIIFGSLVASLPAAVWRMINDVMVQDASMDPFRLILLVLITFLVTCAVIFLEKGQRRIPIQYAKRVVGNKMYAGQSSYIPLKMNPAGVVPVIFAQNMISMPLMLIQYFATRFDVLRPVLGYLDYQGLLYNLIMAGLIVFFSFFYTSIIFNPVELADNLRKSGGVVPGIRPGKKTAEFFYYVLTRVGVPGALYLSSLVLLPVLLIAVFRFQPMYVFSGTALLIVVGVALDTSAQLESALIERRYDGFLASGRLRGRGGR